MQKIFAIYICAELNNNSSNSNSGDSNNNQASGMQATTAAQTIFNLFFRFAVALIVVVVVVASMTHTHHCPAGCPGMFFIPLQRLPLPQTRTDRLLPDHRPFSMTNPCRPRTPSGAGSAAAAVVVAAAISAPMYVP